MIRLIAFFLVSLAIQVYLFSVSPFKSDGNLNNPLVLGFSTNMGLLTALLFMILFGVMYKIFQFHEEISALSHIRRGAEIGVVIFLLLILQFYNILDLFLLIVIVLSAILLELILSYKS